MFEYIKNRKLSIIAISSIPYIVSFFYFSQGDSTLVSNTDGFGLNPSIFAKKVETIHCESIINNTNNRGVFAVRIIYRFSKGITTGV